MTLTELNHTEDDGQFETKTTSENQSELNEEEKYDSNGRRKFSPKKPVQGSELVIFTLINWRLYFIFALIFQQIKKHIVLTARSLLILTGPARYAWAHQISNRKMDKV